MSESSVTENFEAEFEETEIFEVVFGETTLLTNKDFEKLDNRPSYAGELMTKDTDIPEVNDATLTIKQNGTTIGTFTSNDADDVEVDLDDTTYTAGDGINIDEDNDNEISVDTSVIATREYAATVAETAAEEAVDAAVPSGFFTGDATVSGTGSEITLENTLPVTFESVQIEGDTSQVEYEGKNLLDVSAISFQTSQGITAVLDDGDISISGTATGTNPQISSNFSLALEAGTYTLSTSEAASFAYYLHCHTVSGSWTNLRIDAGNTSGTITFTEDVDYFNIRLVTSSGTTYDEIISNLQLELSSAATDYEPYVGGVASPNPDYPQDVNVVTGTQTVTVSDDDGTEGQSYTVDLGSIELCQIGDYQDYIYTDGSDWYLHKETKHLSLAIADMDNSDNWPGWNGVVTDDEVGATLNGNLANVVPYCVNIGSMSFSTDTIYAVGCNNASSNGLIMLPRLYYGTSFTQTYWKANYPDLVVELYLGVLEAGQTDTQITDSTLIAELDALAEAKGGDESTYITVTTSTSGALPAQLEVTAYQKNLAGIIANL